MTDGDGRSRTGRQAFAAAGANAGGQLRQRNTAYPGWKANGTDIAGFATTDADHLLLGQTCIANLDTQVPGRCDFALQCARLAGINAVAAETAVGRSGEIGNREIARASLQQPGRTGGQTVTATRAALNEFSFRQSPRRSQDCNCSPRTATQEAATSHIHDLPLSFDGAAHSRLCRGGIL